MGFLRRLFSSKKPSNPPPPPPTAPNSKPTKNTKRWSFTNKTHTTTSQPNVSNSNSISTPYAADNSDANKHAIAVAAATAAVAEAALAAAHAAAEVVRLTSGGSSAHGGGTHHRWLEVAAVVKIQSAFKGYLARRALRALKALVKLQALVRGHIVRKQTSDMLRRMQTLVRLQARARASRTHKSESLHYNSKFALSHHLVPASPNKNKHQLRAFSTKVDGSSALKRCGSHSNFRNIIDLDKTRYDSNWFDCWMEENLRNSHRETPLRTQQADDEKSDKILEVDTWKPHFNHQQSKKNFQTSQHMLASDYSSQSYMAFNSPSKYSTKATNPNPSLSSGDTLSVSSLKLPMRGDAAATRTSGNSPQVFSASSRPGNGAKRSPFSPTRSEYLWGFFGGYADHPNYMANTESSLAKVRSQSAPRQRLDFGRYGSTKRSYQDAETFSEKGFAHPASSSINRLGRANLR